MEYNERGNRLDKNIIISLLQELEKGNISTETAYTRLKTLPFENLDFARIDHHRAMRTGQPEVILCQGKSNEQIKQIAESLAEKNRLILATRATEENYNYISSSFPESEYHEHGRIISIGKFPETDEEDYILVATGGTSDIPVAEEAALTASAMGSQVIRLYDVGIAGLPRLLSHIDKLREASVIVVVAGMEGALPSLIAGLVESPVIAVPTSIGYGANFQGLSALLTMLNSCAPGIATVNIDNGFGAGYMAALINRRDKA